MDPLAHTLFGATMAETSLRKKTSLAAGACIIGANIPDVDAIAMFVSSDYSLLVRRGWTHGILALVVWPFLLTGGLLLFDYIWRRRKNRSKSRSVYNRRRGNPNSPPLKPGSLLAISFLAVWSHPFLDWFNTYGIRLLMPFDGTWFYGDTLFIVDPWMWLLMAAAVVLARSRSIFGIAGWVVLGTAATALVTGTAVVPLAAKVAWCIAVAAILLIRWLGWFRDRIHHVALGCFGIFALYLLFMFAGSRFTVWQVENKLAARGVEVKEVMPEPLPARLILREGVAVSETHYYLFRVNWLDGDSFEIMEDPIPVKKPDLIVEAALRSPAVQGLHNWMRFPDYEVRALDGGGWRVIIRDLRFAPPDSEAESGFGIAIVDLDEKLQWISGENRSD
ncbi:MAG: metal-dependent hydrolase [Balneolaceae bacterium]